MTILFPAGGGQILSQKEEVKTNEEFWQEAEKSGITPWLQL